MKDDFMRFKIGDAVPGDKAAQIIPLSTQGTFPSAFQFFSISAFPLASRLHI
jgi:hypothetical protein